MRPTVAKENPSPFKGAHTAVWVVQGVKPDGSFVYATIAYGRATVRSPNPLSVKAEVLWGFLTRENTSLETWKAHFPAPGPNDTGIKVEAGTVSLRKSFVKFASDPARRWITPDEESELLARFKPIDIKAQLQAEKRATKDWARFPEATRPVVTGQTVVRNPPIPFPKLKGR